MIGPTNRHAGQTSSSLHGARVCLPSVPHSLLSMNEQERPFVLYSSLVPNFWDAWNDQSLFFTRPSHPPRIQSATRSSPTTLECEWDVL